MLNKKILKMDSFEKGVVFSCYKAHKKGLSTKITNGKQSFTFLALGVFKTPREGVFPKTKVKALQSKTLFYRNLDSLTRKTSPNKLRFISTSSYRRFKIQGIKPKVTPLTRIGDKAPPILAKYPFSPKRYNKSSHSLSKQGNITQELGFTQTGLNGLLNDFSRTKQSLVTEKTSPNKVCFEKQIKDKFSNKGQKDSRGLTFTANHRFIALILRCGKKSVSYNVFLNALSKCKNLLDLSISSKSKASLTIKNVGRSTIETADNSENKNPQNVSSNHSSKSFNSAELSSKRSRDFSIHSKRTKQSLVDPVRVSAIEKNTKNSASLSCRSSTVFVGMDRGTPNRFRGNLLLFYPNFKDIFVSCNPKVKVESLIYNYVDLHTPKSFTCSASLLVREGCKTQAIIQQSRVKRCLLTRRVEFTETKNIKSPSTNDFELKGIRDGFPLSFAPVTSIPTQSKALSLKELDKVLQNKSLLREVLRTLERDKIADHSTETVGTDQALIKTVQRGRETFEQDLSKTPSLGVLKTPRVRKVKQSFLLPLKSYTPKSSSARLLLKQEGSNTKINWDTYEPQRTKIGIDSVNKVSPTVETRKVRVGGATYAVPYVPHNNRQEGLGVRWLIAGAFHKRQKSQYPSSLCLAHELADSFKNEGQSTQKRNQSHQLSAANRAYTRYRWW